MSRTAKTNGRRSTMATAGAIAALSIATLFTVTNVPVAQASTSCATVHRMISLYQYDLKAGIGDKESNIQDIHEWQEQLSDCT